MVRAIKVRLEGLACLLRLKEQSFWSGGGCKKQQNEMRCFSLLEGLEENEKLRRNYMCKTDAVGAGGRLSVNWEDSVRIF